MKKVILTLVTTSLAACLGMAHAQEPADASVSTDQTRAEMRQKQADGIRSKKENVARAHKKILQQGKPDSNKKKAGWNGKKK